MCKRIPQLGHNLRFEKVRSRSITQHMADKADNCLNWIGIIPCPRMFENVQNVSQVGATFHLIRYSDVAIGMAAIR